MPAEETRVKLTVGGAIEVLTVRGVDFGRIHGGTDGRREPGATQEKARRKVTHGGTDGRRSQGGNLSPTDSGDTGKYEGPGGV